MIFYAMDANFRLNNRLVSSLLRDPIMGDGLGYFVNHARYIEYILKHVDQEEISSCAGFLALLLATAKRIKGMRSTGVGGCTCARHNMWAPNGIGDLQKGERYASYRCAGLQITDIVIRYCNMDFIIASALSSIDATLPLCLSYDIACQWSKHFWERMKSLPADLQPVPRPITFKVPNFHLPAHKPPCHSPYSFHFMLGAADTNGEGIEQNWEFANGAGPSTKLMGPGSRQLMLEDLFGFHNYRRLVAMSKFRFLSRWTC